MRQLFYTYVMCMGMWFIFAGAVQSHAANGGEGVPRCLWRHGVSGNV